MKRAKASGMPLKYSYVVKGDKGVVVDGGKVWVETPIVIWSWRAYLILIKNARAVGWQVYTKRSSQDVYESILRIGPFEKGKIPKEHEINEMIQRFFKEKIDAEVEL